ncbi:MAG: hypothetical protein PHV02_19725 [Rhodocyclaceae bacterium]|nr:hypothetical protein [Rhodocyclaceae bacterium]
MKNFNLSISVSTNADVTGKQVADILKRLIDAGLSDAQDTVESGEGDLASAALATDLNISAPVVIKQETSVKVKHWGAYHVEGTVDTHQFDIADQRETNGQAYITVGALEGSDDDLLSVTMEINTSPLNGIDHVPCAHVHFDGDSVAVSLFKIGNKILVRPETEVSIEPFFQNVNGFGEQLYWID